MSSAENFSQHAKCKMYDQKISHEASQSCSLIVSEVMRLLQTVAIDDLS